MLQWRSNAPSGLISRLLFEVVLWAWCFSDRLEWITVFTGHVLLPFQRLETIKSQTTGSVFHLKFFSLLIKQVMLIIGKAKKNKQKCNVRVLSHIWLFATPWTIACQAPLLMEFSSQEYWSEVPFPTPGGLCNPGFKPVSLECFTVDSFTTVPPGKPF